VCAERALRAWRNADAAAAVEFALCLPVFLMMVLGIIQFGLTQHSFSSVRYAMQRASRALVVDPNITQATLQSMVGAQLAKTTSAQVTVSLVKTNTANGKLATLSAVYVAQFGVPTLATFNIPYQVTITKALRSTP
jgi:Flp pilus assembly protein TadG